MSQSPTSFFQEKPKKPQTSVSSLFDRIKERKKTAENCVNRQAVIRDLASLWKNESEIFDIIHELSLKDSSYLVRIVALQELAKGWGALPGTLELLMEVAASETDEFVREAALQELIDGWREDEVQKFVEVLRRRK